jgi:hypothetical protein
MGSRIAIAALTLAGFAMSGAPALAADDEDVEERVAELEATTEARDAELEERVAELEATTARKGNLQIGARAAQVKLPGQIQFGTKFGENGPGPVAGSEQTQDGENFNASASLPTGFFFPGTEVLVDFSNTTFDGSSGGSVPIGGRDVAYPYIKPFGLPGGGESTGIAAGDTGTGATGRSDGEIFDVTGAFTFPLGGIRGLVGARYRNFEWNNDVHLSSRTFPDLNQGTWMKQESDFFGAVFGVQFERLPEQGFTYGADLRVALGQQDTSARVSQVTRAGPLGKDNPEFRVRQSQNLSADDFSTIFGGSAHIGWRFWPSLEVRLEGSVEQMTDVPYIDFTYSPDLQPIRFGFGDLTEATIGGRLIWRLSRLHYHRHAVAQDY